MNELGNPERMGQIVGSIVLIIGIGALVLIFWLWSIGAYPFNNPIAGFNLFGIVVMAIPVVAMVVMGVILIILYTQRHAEECVK